MLSKFVSEGDKLELRPVGKTTGEEVSKLYYSKVLDIRSEDTLEIIMPMEQAKLVLLPVDSEYDVVFYGDTGLFQCFVRIVDRYKSDNLHILVVELTSNLRKYQRREFYRFSCALEMCSRNLEEEELQNIEENDISSIMPGIPLKRSVIVDISGGGLRFMSPERYEPDSLIYCCYHLHKNGELKLYEVVGKVLAVRELENKKGTYEHRVQYHNLDNEVREEIIKFIFEEERKSRKKERLL